MKNKNYDYIAIDISKSDLEIRTDQHRCSFTNNLTGFKALVKLAGKQEQPLVVCESSGGYERDMMDYLHQKQIPLTRVNPGRIRNYARSEGMKAKTDPIDASMILGFAREKQLQPIAPIPPIRQELAALLDRRNHLTEQAAREKNRAQNSSKFIKQSIHRMIKVVEKEIQRIEQQIEKIVNNDQQITEEMKIFESVVGVGKVTAWTVLAYLSEIGTLKRNQIVALAGIAPYNKDTGVFKGRRTIEGGRAKVRKCLYMAAQTAARHNPVIKPYVEASRPEESPTNGSWSLS